MASANTLPGYSVLKSAAQQLAERHNNIPPTFEVLDLKTFSRTEVENTPKSVKKAKRITKQKNIVEVAEDIQNERSKSEDLQSDNANSEACLQEGPVGHKGILGPVGVKATEPVVFITPYTEVEILASEVFVNETVFSIISPQEDRVRIKPKRGAKLDAIYNGETYHLYASGVYIPVTALNSVLSIFFVMDENNEEV